MSGGGGGGGGGGRRVRMKDGKTKEQRGKKLLKETVLDQEKVEKRIGKSKIHNI